MATIAEVKTKIESANALGIANLTEKGVEIGANATTYEIMKNIAEVAGGGGQYKSVTYNEDNTVTLVDKKGVYHVIECEYTNNKLTGVTYDGSPIELIYNDSTLVGIGKTEINLGDSFPVTESKEEQEKTVPITENGMVEVLPDENKVLSKVTVNVDVQGGTEEIEDLIDNSGVLDSTEGTATEKVEQLIDLVEKSENAIVSLDHTVTFMVDGEPYEIVSVKNGNKVGEPVSLPAKEGQIVYYWLNNGVKQTMPFIPTSDMELTPYFTAGMTEMEIANTDPLITMTRNTGISVINKTTNTTAIVGVYTYRYYDGESTYGLGFIVASRNKSGAQITITHEDISTQETQTTVDGEIWYCTYARLIKATPWDYEIHQTGIVDLTKHTVSDPSTAARELVEIYLRKTPLIE